MQKRNLEPYLLAVDILQQFDIPEINVMNGIQLSYSLYIKLADILAMFGLEQHIIPDDSLKGSYSGLYSFKIIR